MEIKEYSKFVEKMWFSGKDRPLEEGITIASLGLAGETGEVMELLKKRLRDGKYDQQNLKKELGDMLYYWCKVGAYFGITPEEIMQTNVEKLTSRALRGVMRGSGDDR